MDSGGLAGPLFFKSNGAVLVVFFFFFVSCYGFRCYHCSFGCCSFSLLTELYSNAYDCI